MAEPIKKRVDESWKEQAEREKHTSQPSPAEREPSKPPNAESGEAERGRQSAQGEPQARFDLFVSGLAMEAFIALGDLAHPTTRKSAMNLPHAKYLIDLLGILEEKTKGNVTVEEAELLKETLYQLRMRYLAKATPP
jgi:hypothetical protein